MPLTDYRTLGRSGLVVSPMTLGTMTFGAGRWGTDEAASRAVFDAYVEAGGNSVDTAQIYSGGASEEMLGRFIADARLRDRTVLATKFGWSPEPGNPLMGGNGAKAVRAALDGSLTRLGTDYLDLYWLHVWDTVTPAEEVLRTFSDLIAAGKIRYYGLSNVPAWWTAKLATLAAAHGQPGPVALQMEYSLTDRTVEREHLPAAREFGLGLMPWSPLAGGFLTGKYRREDARETTAPSLPDSGGAAAESGSRLSGANPFGDMKFTERNWAILAALETVAAEIGATPAQTALAWTLARPGVPSLLLGASRPEQVTANMAALEVRLTAEQTATLDAVSAAEGFDLYSIFGERVNRMVFGGAAVRGLNAR